MYLERDSLLGIDAQGDIVAWALAALLPIVAEPVKVAVPGGVHPQWRGAGLGTAMLAWKEARARELIAGVGDATPEWLSTYADEVARERIALHERKGYDLRRWWFEMSRALNAPIADVPLDPDVRLQMFGPEWSEVTRQARNTVFEDHWGSQATQPADWEAARNLPIARHDLSWLAVDRATDEVVGFVLTSVDEHEWAAAGYSFGYLEYVGVRREWRGRGIAQALINHTMRAYRDEGLSHATLDVDSESPTGADGLYGALGFRPINRAVSLVKDI